MNGNLWTFLGALLIAGALGMIYSWKVEADRAAELEAQVHRLEQRIQADDAAMALRERERREAEQIAQEQRDALHEMEKNSADLRDDDFLRRLRGVCFPNGNNCAGAAGNPAGGMPGTDSAARHDGGK